MQNKLGIGITAAGAILIIITAILGWAVVPNIIENKIKDEFQLVEGSQVYETWENISYPIYLSFYIYHVTNPDQFEAGEPPILDEKGPYVYLEKMTKVELTHYDMANPENTLQYRERRRYFFDEEKSGNLKESDRVNIFNVPFVSVIDGVRQVVPAFAPVVANQMLPYETLIRRNVSVKEMLFDGFDVTNYTNNPVLNLLLPDDFSGGTFGLYKGENETDSLLYDIYTGVDNHEDFGKIRSYNNSEYLGYFPEGTHCDVVRGSSDGSLFPPFVKKDSKFYVFSSDVCRKLLFVYDEEEEFKDVKVYRFRVLRSQLEDPITNPANECYCLKETLEECPKSGIMTLEGCRGGAPVLMSTPHFIGGWDGYLNDTGLSAPTIDEHLTYLDIQPDTGVLLRSHKRVQVNVELIRGYNINAYKNQPKDMVFPVMWADENAEIDDDTIDDLKSRLLKPKQIVDITKWVLIGVGIVVVLVGAFVFYKRRKSTETV